MLPLLERALICLSCCCQKGVNSCTSCYNSVFCHIKNNDTNKQCMKARECRCVKDEFLLYFDTMIALRGNEKCFKNVCN